MRTQAEITSLQQAVAELIHDGDTIALEGFTHLIPFAAGHEIIRQGSRDLTLVRMTPDIVYDQLIGAGCARKLIFSWGGNPGVGSLHRFRDAVENAGRTLEIEEHSHAGMANRYVAGASGLPFAVLRGYRGTAARAHGHDQADHLPVHRRGADRRPGAQPRRRVIHAQQADRDGNVQLWGLTGVQKEAVLGAKRSARHRRGDRRRAGAAPRRRRAAGLGRHPRRRGAGRRPALLRAGLLRPRQRRLPAWDAICRDRDVQRWIEDTSWPRSTPMSDYERRTR